MEYVERLLGAPYSISGTVVHGRALGRKMGMPTVNIVPGEHKLLPPCGVYFSEVCMEGKVYPSISNIGYKPTVNEERVLGVETYLYDFDEDIYEKEICVRLLSFKRAEKQFASIDDLKRQMGEDIRAGKEFHMCKND
jgi:riboflavin kinase/FMN adenylyltransferase